MDCIGKESAFFVRRNFRPPLGMMKVKETNTLDHVIEYLMYRSQRDTYENLIMDVVGGEPAFKVFMALGLK